MCKVQTGRAFSKRIGIILKKKNIIGMVTEWHIASVEFSVVKIRKIRDVELFISVTVILLLRCILFFPHWGNRNKYAKDGASINK